MKRLKELTERDWYLIGAGASLAVEWLPLAIGYSFDVYPLLWWGTVGMYLGFGWLTPGALVGAAFAQAAKSRGTEHPNRVGVGAGIGFTVLFLVMSSVLLAGATLADGDAEPDPFSDQASPPTSTEKQAPKGDLAATIRASASAASPDRRVTSVDCFKPVDIDNVFLLTCAVTFEGPACQLWLASGLDDPEPFTLGDPIEGRNGRSDERSAHCD